MKRVIPTNRGGRWIAMLTLAIGLWWSAVCVAGSTRRNLSGDMFFRAPASSSSEESGTVLWKEVLFKWVNLAILLGGLTYLLRKPLVNFFAARSEEIRRALEEALAAKNKAEQDLAMVQEKFSKLEKEIAELKSAAAAQTDAERQRILDAARREGEKIVASAEEEIDLLVKRAQKQLREHSAALVVEMAEQKLKSEIGPQHQGPLFKRFLTSLEKREQSK